MAGRLGNASASPHNFNAFAVYKRVGNTMMIDISSPSDEREETRRRDAVYTREKCTCVRKSERERLLGSAIAKGTAKGARRRGGSSQKHRIEIESQVFYQSDVARARIARNPRGATARPSRQGAAPTPYRTRYCVVCSCCEQPLHQELINLRGYRWL